MVELLVSLAILSLVLAGIYGLLNSAYQTYLSTRRRIESQQIARTVMDYLVYRLREIDGGDAPADPWNCKQCHEAGRAVFPLATSQVPCQEDVIVPRKSLYIEELTEVASLEALEMSEIPDDYTVMSGNKIVFIADLLPLYGFSESFTESPEKQNDTWDWVANGYGDVNPKNGIYDYGEYELLEDLNENGEHDFFGETWTLQLKRADDKQTYALIETLDFTSLRPLTKVDGKIKYNKSVYDDIGYTDEIVAEGIINLSIKRVKKVVNPSPGNGKEVEKRCQDPADSTGCHGSSASGTTNIYKDADNFSLAQFVATHDWWNVRGLSIELTTAARKGGTTHLTTLKQFVIPRNIEINK